MSQSQIPIEKQVYNKVDFSRVIDTQFTQLINTEATPEEPLPPTVEEFFRLYDELFFEIPKEGEIDSHRYILEREAEYLGVSLETQDFQALLDEITNLRQELLDSQKALNDLQNSNQTILLNGR